MVIKSSPHIWPTKEIFNRLNGCWVACKKRLLEILGEFKDKTADRWISLTRDWDPEVSNHVSKWKTINQKYAIGNEYMIPTKAQKLSKLSAEWAIAAFELVKDRNAGKQMASAEVLD